MRKFFTVLLWVGGLIAVAYLIGKSIVDAVLASNEGQLAVARAEHDHKERMADKFIQYHRQANGSSRHFYHSDFRPEA